MAENYSRKDERETLSPLLIDLINENKQLRNDIEQIKKEFSAQQQQFTEQKTEFQFQIAQLKRQIQTEQNKPKWNSYAITIAGGCGRGEQLNALYWPEEIVVHGDQTIYVADCRNNRIMEWKKGATEGRILVGSDHLRYPTNLIIDQQNDALIISTGGFAHIIQWPLRTGQTGQRLMKWGSCSGLAMDKEGFLYVLDQLGNEVRRWKPGESERTLVAGGNGQGQRLDQFNSPSGIFVDENTSIYVADGGNNRVMKWVKGAKEGMIVAGGHGKGQRLSQLDGPRGIFVDQSESVYVVDSGNHRVVRWMKGSREGEILLGGYGSGYETDQLCHPAGLCFDGENNLYVSDSANNRIQKFALISTDQKET